MMKNMFTSIKKSLFIFLLLTLIPLMINAQDTLSIFTNKDAIYSRPFLYQAKIGQGKTAIGGYLEGNTNYFSTDGISEGFSMELRRFNIFLSSEIIQGIRFLSELEFEHGTEEIALETAIPPRPCLATITDEIISGTDVPTASTVMAITTSGI